MGKSRLEAFSDGVLAGAAQIGKSELLVGAMLAVALHDRGYAFTAALGEPVTFTVRSRGLEPFEVMQQLRSGAISARDWAAFCAETGLAGHDMAELGSAPQPDR